MTTSLERKSIPEDTSTVMAEESVLEYAADHLKYQHPQKAILCKGPLARVLRVAGIAPFTHESVNTYKRERVKKIQDGMKKGPKLAMKITTAILALVISIWWIAAHYFSMKMTDDGFLITLGIMFSLVVIGIIFPGLTLDQTEKTIVTWRQTLLNKYSDPVPGFVLSTAQEIHQREPRVKFFVDELIIEKSPAGDPFLMVKLEDEEYFVEVWEEPDYKQQRQA